MFIWDTAPFARYAFVLILGICLAFYTPFFPSYGWVSAFLLSGAAYLFGFWRYRRKRLLPAFSGWAGLVCVFAAGGFRASIYIGEGQLFYDSVIAVKKEAYIGRVAGRAEDKGGYWRFDLEVEAIKQKGGSWIAASGIIKQSLEKTEGQAPPVYGEKIAFKGNFKPLEKPQNPGEFDYARYMYWHNIRFTGYAREHTYVKLSEGGGFLAFSHAARARLAGYIERWVSGLSERSLVAALSLGITDGLSADDRDAFSASGATHVLSVSGLHVGIVMEILAFMFSFLRKRKSAKPVYWIFALMVLWVYAFITGLSPSVLRAAVMFSFLETARAFGRQYSIYNSIFASAFFLLLAAPYMLMGLGFQLSYLALLGIVYFYPKIYALWSPRFWVADKFWQCVAVSLAAQLPVTPLCLYVFHQFPLYFAFTNLFAGIMAFAVLVLSMPFFVFAAFFEPLASPLGQLLGWTAGFFNWMVHGVASLPWAVLDNLPFDGSQLLFAYISIVFFSMFAQTKSIKPFAAGATAFLLMTGVFLYEKIERLSWVRFVSYQIKDTPNLVLAEGGMVWVFGTETLSGGDMPKARYHLKNDLMGMADGKPIFIQTNSEATPARKIVFKNTKNGFLLVRRGKIFLLNQNLENSKSTCFSKAFIEADGSNYWSIGL